MVKGAKTIAQYCILKWMDANFYLSALQIELIDGSTVRITDSNRETAFLVYRDGEVRMEAEEP